MNGIGAIRLSQLSDATTSPERQEERIRWWAAGNEVNLAAVTSDLNVSGAVSPFERPGLGPWLADNPPAEWTVLISWKLDRISRSADDTFALLKWCRGRGKRIVCVDDSIDSETQMGQLWIKLAAIFAEVERTAISERALASRDKLRRSGRWTGPAPAYGMKAEPFGNGWTLVRDPDSYPHLRWITDRLLAGDTMLSIATRLNDARVLAPADLRREQAGRATKGARWHASTIKQLMSRRSLTGHVTHAGELVRGDDGLPVSYAESALTVDEWQRVQQVFTAPSRTRTNTPSLLLDVAWCLRCETAKLHHDQVTRGGTVYRYYRCQECGGKRIRAADLEDAAEHEVKRRVGDEPVTEKVLVPGTDTSRDLEEAREAYRDLAARTGGGDAAKSIRAHQMDTLETRMAELEAQPRTEDEWIEQPTGETYRQAWDRMDTPERRNLLINAGFRIYAAHGEEWIYELDVRRFYDRFPGRRERDRELAAQAARQAGT